MITLYKQVNGLVRYQAKKFLLSGTSDNAISEQNRQIVMVNLFGLVGQLVTLLFSVIAFLTADIQLGLVLLVASIVFSIGHFIVSRTGNYYVAGNIIVYILMVLCLYLILSGGVDGTGPLWMYLLPPVTLFFSGLKRGVIKLIGFMLIVAFSLFYDAGSFLMVPFTNTYKVRLLFVFSTLVFLSAYYEYSRNFLFEYLLKMQDKYERQAKEDELTNLLNRRGMSLLMEHEFNRIRRNQSCLSIMLCDVDYFKAINDQYGHETGDKVLVALADIFQRAIRQQDVVARWGGEEFIFLLPGTSLGESYSIAEKIRKAVCNEPITVNGFELTVNVSIGLAEITVDSGLSQAVREADSYLYKAKSLGRNCVMPTPE